MTAKPKKVEKRKIGKEAASEPVEKKKKIVQEWIQKTDAKPKPLAEGEKKKKRPWRSKVRKLAAKKAKAEERAKEGNEMPEVKISQEGEATKKKKKRGPKKKKYRPEVAEATEASAISKEPENVIESAKKRLEAGRFRFLNEKLYTCTGDEAFEYFKEDPAAFEVYHKGFADQVKKWPNHPLQEIVRWLKSKPDKLSVFDLGCGEAKIAEAVAEKHNVSSFDLVAVNDRVTACDMSKLPAEPESADIVIFCLSLMGTNLYDFVKEARRVLKIGGILKIAEVSSRFVSIKMFCEAVCKMGFEMVNKKQLTDYFVMFEFRKIEKVEQKRPYGLKLKPCLYKKR